MSQCTNLLVIGNGMVGQRLLEALYTQPSQPPPTTTVLCEEPRAAYDRVNLSSYLTGTSAEALSLADSDFIARTGVQLHLSERAIAIDRQERQVRTASGRVFGYDHLVLATGSSPFVPALPGRDRPGCFVYRTLEDLDVIREASAHARRGVVIGGGLLGLEAARALQGLNLETHVVEAAAHLMAAQLDEASARMLRERIEALGIAVHTDRKSVEISQGEHFAHRLRFADGRELETDLIVFSAGIRARDELAREAQLAVGERGGIVIDDDCRTSDPCIFAIGECAAWNGRLYGLVAPGYRMAAVVAERLRGMSATRFSGADMSTRLKLLGVEVATIGDSHASSPGAKTCALIDEQRQIYKKLVMDAGGSRLLGAILLGDTADYATLLQMVQSGTPLPPLPQQLLVPASTQGAVETTVPDDAQVCSCNGVSKATLLAAVRAGAVSIDALKRQTGAARTCGGCSPVVAKILKAELASAGAASLDHLCEHFAYSRQQLFDLVRITGLRSFDAVRQRHGRGLGCDICKPVVASILASCWNDFVLAADKVSLQDSNDQFLANIQKDGTYSIVPRVAAGEITPAQLISIGRIADKYQLYTKITGAQRIDMLGAQVHQLPLIWDELVRAGFESGHAYGKAVRTVKSCVGSTWCRYGVQDSVALAIELEHRYKGIRAPHKLKFAVSGCTRECAEAQSKDVGVIATAKGWNLYVCGNGGMRPRHAELLASDLDRASLIRYIDRFLMFYIRTADRLQRTAVWREALQGGLAYLQQVVCEDRLGIAAELEADMQRLIDTYECEWKRTLQDPQALRRFRQFINSECSDEGVVFVQERGQPRPARAEERLLQGVSL